MLRFVNDSPLEAPEDREHHLNQKDPRALGALPDQLALGARCCPLGPLHPLRLQALRALADQPGLLDQLTPVGPCHPWVLAAPRARSLLWALQVLEDQEFLASRSPPLPRSVLELLAVQRGPQVLRDLEFPVGRSSPLPLSVPEALVVLEVPVGQQDLK